MPLSPATIGTIARVLSGALVSAARELPQFEAGVRVWVKVKACERLMQRGLGPTVWREGIVVQCLDGGRFHQVFVPGSPSFTVVVGPSQIRLSPPWTIDALHRRTGPQP